MLIFRGSVDINNWINNLKFNTVGYPGCSGCQVHQGFYEEYRAMSEKVKDEVTKYKQSYSRAKLYLGGHSLGGALAILAALDIVSKDYDIVDSKGIHADELYTFGQPRLGDTNFAHYCSSKIENLFRVVNYEDIVPHLPPGITPYRHFGK
jgi:predicted lipase